jgi:hypothetical protein
MMFVSVLGTIHAFVMKQPNARLFRSVMKQSEIKTDIDRHIQMLNDAEQQFQVYIWFLSASRLLYAA